MWGQGLGDYFVKKTLGKCGSEHPLENSVHFFRALWSVVGN